jgi:hypothetical protein
VHIISGGPYEVISRYLAERQIKYSRLWCIYDYFAQRKELKILPDGSFRVDDELWNNAKAEYCQRENICFHIDDSTFYGRNFKIPYCLYDNQYKICRLNSREIDFTHSPQRIFREISQICEAYCKS